MDASDGETIGMSTSSPGESRSSGSVAVVSLDVRFIEEFNSKATHTVVISFILFS